MTGPDPHPPPRVVGRYLLCDPIASGGMATVHLGRALGVEGFSRTVAIKHLHAHFAQDDEFVSMLLDEARLLSRIRHSNVVAPLDVVTSEGEVFVVVEYVHAEPLSRLERAADGPIGPRVASALMSQVLLGLHAAHEATGEGGQFLGIVHRDISPQNILVGQDGTAKIVDFGIAKAAWRAHTTHTGQFKGKPGYMAPEQRVGGPIDRRADVYASGIVLWEMLTGHRLYRSTAEGVMDPDQLKPPSKLAPGVPRSLDAVVLRALSRDPTDRFDSAHAMATALESATDLASTLEVANWVHRLVGSALSSRAERIAELEELRVDEVTPQQSGPRAAALASRPSASSPVSSELGTTPTVVARGSAVSTPEASTGAKLRGTLTASIAGAIAALVVVYLALPREAGAPAREPADRTPANGLEAPLAPSLAAGAQQMISKQASAEATPPSARDAREPAPDPAAGREPEVTQRASRPTAAPPTVPTARATAKPSARGAIAPATPKRDCDPPYVIDENGFKRFRIECVESSE